ncbi:MAG: iron-containing alcohol dehydrogenase [Defluviitaleaceae bacterium]|nr:iron-containing alcohol dehydrogenase [Defluviitaleaceae bacterium]
MTHNPIITQVAKDSAALSQWFVMAGHTNILVIADDNTADFAKKVIGNLSTAKLFTLSPALPNTDLVPDEAAIGKIFVAAKPYQDNRESSALLAVGSGTICDLVRYVSTRLGLTYYIVATAASMDGYTSTVTSPIVGNIKQAYPAVPPAGVIIDPAIYETAPGILTAAGFGDIMGKFVAVIDWEMEGRVIPDEDMFCQDLANEMRQVTEECFKAKTPASIMDALVDSGLIIQKAGHSRPAACSEHHLSHYWEMMALMKGHTPALHGAKVGMATLAVLQAQEWLLEEEITDSMWDKAEENAASFDTALWQEDIRNHYSYASEEILALWPDETPATRAALIKAMRDNWPSLRIILFQGTGMGEKVKEAIADLGGPTTPAQLGVCRDTFVSGVLYSNRIRRRFSTWRLLDLLGLLPSYAERLADLFCE